jgi:polyferredoxin
MYHQVIVYDWPESQTCMDCEHGEFVESETFSSSNYICKVGSVRNSGSACPDKKEVINEPCSKDRT